MTTIVRFFNNESGTSAIDYGLIAAATGLAVAAILPILGSSISATYIAFGNNLD